VTKITPTSWQSNELFREVWGFLKMYNSGHSDTRCKICTFPREPFLHATPPSICAASLSASQQKMEYLLKLLWSHKWRQENRVYKSQIVEKWWTWRGSL